MTPVYAALGPSAGKQLPEPYAARFGGGDLRGLRRATAEWAERAGMAAHRAADFVAAVNEIASNAIRFGSPAAELALRVTGEDVAEAEVRDTGRWALSVWAETVNGRGRLGLALVRRICDEVEIETSGSGTTVTVRMSVASGDEPEGHDRPAE